MKAKNLRLHVLAIGNGSGLPALREIATATGGTVTSAADANTWAAYWHNGYVFIADFGRGIDIVKLTGAASRHAGAAPTLTAPALPAGRWSGPVIPTATSAPIICLIS